MGGTTKAKTAAIGASGKNIGPDRYVEEYGKFVRTLLEDIDTKAISKVIECFLAARKNNATIFFAGNGGSAATASHFAQDLSEISKKVGTKSFTALSLADSVPLITAIGNDHGYESIFTGQMNHLFKKGDLLVVISASGNSPNIVNAVKLARQRGGTAIGIIGFDGGLLKRLCDHVIHIPTDKGHYGPVEDMHLIVEHMITTYITRCAVHGKDNIR